MPGKSLRDRNEEKNCFIPDSCSFCHLLFNADTAYYYKLSYEGAGGSY